MYTPAAHLWPPQRRGLLETIDLLNKGLDVCLYGPTGSGKTTMATELLQWAVSQACRGCFYVNRRLLIGQTSQKFAAAGLPHAIRAAEYDDLYDWSAPVQIVSPATELSRVYQTKTWELHESQLVIVDEAHIEKQARIKKILDDHKSRGARVVLLTATPIGLSHMANKLVVSGTMQEYRDCKALVPCVVKTISQPDMHKVQRNKTGEFVIDGEKRRVYTQTIVADVMDRWKMYNPDARPTLLYAPDVAGSRWFTEKFRAMGVNWCHVDATEAMVDGTRASLTRALWQEILERFQTGDITGISSRFKLREGVDVPFAYHAILATPIGSLASYIQTIGRILRYSPETPDHVLVTDHGGNYIRHGSPNDDRCWQDWWGLSEHTVSCWNENEIRESRKPEPIRCPRCEGERKGGIRCPHCGFEHGKSVRQVIMADGTMVEREGHLIRPKYIRRKPDTAKLWEKMYWNWHRAKKAATRAKSFAQMDGWFAHKYGYHPPRDIPFMPKQSVDWCRSVGQVGPELLTGALANRAPTQGGLAL